MGSTPRPSISVEHLDLNKRSWPYCPPVVYRYDSHNFAFKLTQSDSTWDWPWPRWVGLPTKTTTKEWFDLLDGWKILVMKKHQKDDVEKAIGRLLPYLG